MPGYDRALYVLPFDHRGSFQKGLFGITATPTAEQTAEVASYKKVIYDGFLQAVENGVPKDKAGILVDEQFGADIVLDARSKGFEVAMPAEKSGQNEFDFEYGEDFGAHITQFDPTFCKVLVRYNTGGDADMNSRQAQRLARLGQWLRENDRYYMFELLVPAEDSQLESVGGDKSKFDNDLRPQLMVDAIAELQSRGVDPDVWKIEGVSDPDGCKAIVSQVQADGRENVGCIVLGRGENEQKVVEWLSVAAKVPGYIGFAVGRTTFWDALVDLKEGRSDEKQAATRIAEQYRRFVDLFESSR